MKTKLLFILLLVFGCDYTSPVDVDTSGCPIEESCNYNPDAIDEENCWYPNDGCICEDGKDAVSDNCGICDVDEENDCIQDCNGDWGGNELDVDADEICDNIDECIDVNNDSVCDSFGQCEDCFDITVINDSNFEMKFYFANAILNSSDYTQSECYESGGSWNPNDSNCNICFKESPIAILDYSSDSSYLISNVINSENSQHCIYPINLDSGYIIWNSSSGTNYAFILVDSSVPYGTIVHSISCDFISSYECLDD